MPKGLARQQRHVVRPGWEQCRKLLYKKSIEVSRNVLIDAFLEQCAASARIDDRRAEAAQIVDGTIDDIDRLMIGLREQALVHIFTNDADLESIETRFPSKASISFFRHAPHAVDGQIIGRIKAG